MGPLGALAGLLCLASCQLLVEPRAQGNFSPGGWGLPARLSGGLLTSRGLHC